MKAYCAVALLVTTTFCVAPARAYTNSPWTAVASTGAVDEAAHGIYIVSGPALGYSPSSTSTDTIVSRFNVTVSDYTQVPPWNTLEIAYWDNSAGGSVSATLWEVVPNTGAQTALCTVTSVDSSTPTLKTCYFLATPLDFRSYVYYVTVKLTRDSTLPLPCAYSVRIFD